MFANPLFARTQSFLQVFIKIQISFENGIKLAVLSLNILLVTHKYVKISLYLEVILLMSQCNHCAGVRKYCDNKQFAVILFWCNILISLVIFCALIFVLSFCYWFTQGRHANVLDFYRHFFLFSN